MKLGDELYTVSAEWISGCNNESLLSRRNEVIAKLRDNYWQIDPYIRARSLMDRTGVIKEGGKVDFYPSKAPVQVDEKSEITTEHVDNAQLATAAA